MASDDVTGTDVRNAIELLRSVGYTVVDPAGGHEQESLQIYLAGYNQGLQDAGILDRKRP